MNSALFTANNNFQTWSAEHLIVLFLFAIFGYVLIRWAKGQTQKVQFRVGNYLSFSLFLTIVVWTLCRIVLGVFDLTEDLPLVLCNMLALLMPIFTMTRNPLLYQVFYYWILAATVQATLTPHLYNNLPHYNAIKYWMVHCGLIVVIFYATFIYGFRPKFKSIFTAFLALQPYAVFCMLVNHLVGANYLYLNFKPDTPSLLDFLGPWPVYVFVAELMAIPFFAVFYLPVYFLEERERKL